jgi:arylsulfatase A-like enzyme
MQALLAILVAGLGSPLAATTGTANPSTTTPPPATAPPPPAGRQGIILITIDSLRIDRVGGYAPDRPPVTPAIDLVAATGVRFASAFTPSVSTVPSAASVLTGLLPSGHGLRDDLGGHLAPGVKTIADRLRAAGWATAAVVGTNRLDSERGLAGGFDRYDDQIKGIRKAAVGLSKERRAAEVTDRGLLAIDSLPPDRPFFLWLHYYDPHYDYDPEEPQKSAYSSSPYDGEVAAVDASIGAALRSIRDRTTGGRLLFVVAGTHGEALGDRGETGHGIYLNDVTTRVPLVMTLGRPGVGGGRVVGEPVSLLDVAPTLLEFAGLPPVPGLAGVSQAAALAADGGGTASTAGTDRARKHATPRRMYVEAVAPATSYGYSPLFSVTEGNRRVVQGARLEAFDLEADPGAAHPLTTAPRWAKDLVAYGRERFGSLEPSEARRREIEAAIAALQPPWEGSPLCGSRDSKPDPRDPLPLSLQDVLFVMSMDGEQGLPGRAQTKGSEILEKDPSNPAALESVVYIALRNHWGDSQILEPLEVLTCQYPYRPEGYHYLGHFYSLGKRDLEKAVRAFTLMGLTNPGDQEADYDLACTYAAMGRPDEAFAHLKASIAKGSDDFEALRRDGRLATLRDDPRFQALVPANPQ